jgi:hypothetical protein
MHSNYGESRLAGKSIRSHCARDSAGQPSFVRAMRLFLLTVAACTGFAAPARAQTPQDDLLFARNLRAHYLPDLAAAFLENPPSPAAGSWRAAIAIERARARREYALKTGGSLALMLCDSARREHQASLQGADAKPLEQLIRFELARLAAAEGHLLLERQARGSGKQSAIDMKSTRAKLGEAAQLLKDCAAPTNADNASFLAADEGDFAGHLALERGRTAVDLALANGSTDRATERGAALRQAIAEFDGLARSNHNNPLAWEAMAWLYRCHLDNDDAKASKKVLTDVNATKNKAAENGKRLIKVLRLLWLIRENDIRTQTSIQAECEDWLKQYPEAYDSDEGWQLRSFLARAAFAQTAAATTKAPVTGKTREAFERAWRLCSDVDLPERDEAGLARKRRLQIAKVLYPDLSTPGPEKIGSPVEGWLRAQLAFADIQSAPADTTPEARRARWLELRGLLEKVLAMPAMHRFPREAVENKQLLTYCLYMSGEMSLAADEGEALARTHPHDLAAAQAGNLALQALATLMAKTPAPGAEAAKAAPLRTRFNSLAEFMLHAWADRPQVDTTRHLYCLLLAREKRFAAALDQIDALSAGYAELPRALYQGATLALEARNENASPPANAAPYRDRAVRFLERIPRASTGNDAKSLQTIFAAKRLLAELYLQAKQWPELDRVVDETVAGFQDLDENNKAGFRAPLLALQLFAKSIAADRACQGGRFHEGRQTLAPAVATVRDPANAPILEELKQREPVVLSRFLDLSIRTAVLDDDPAAAKEQLELLTRLFPDNPLDLVGATMQALSEQIGSLRKQGEPAKALLEKTTANVAIFLDSLAEQQKLNARPESLLFLAESFASIDEFAKAGAFASRIEAPTAENDARGQQVYRSARVLVLRSLRRQKNWKQAEALLDTLLATPWGPNSLDLKKERLFLLQDQEKFAGKQGAILGWNSFMMQLQPRLQDNRIKELYFEGYYQLTYCIYRNALAQSDAKAKQKDLRLAANYILKLENQPDPAAEPCKKRLRELLAEALPLREQYESLKKEGL